MAINVLARCGADVNALMAMTASRTRRRKLTDTSHASAGIGEVGKR
jgi:hypothetical protein